MKTEQNTPDKVMERLCWKAVMSIVCSSKLRGRRGGQPGAFYMQFTTPQEREILKDLTSEDLRKVTMRPEFYDIS